MLPTIPMPSLCAGIRGTLIVASMPFCFPIFAAENLAPSDIQTVFATGKPFSIRGATILELEHGKIRRCIDYWDMAAFLKQLGHQFA